jgi:hypothetical protein
VTQLKEREVKLRLPPDSFFKLFVKLNKLDQISRFLFPSGMLFNDTRQWWGSKKRALFREGDPCHERNRDVPAHRPHPHEGIDIYLMEHVDMSTSTVLPQMLIPAILPGYQVHFHRDFLGETLYIRHPEIRKENAVLHTLYGHIRPAERCIGLQNNTDLTCPSFINKGQIVGKITPPPGTTSVPAHLHVSCAWIDEDQQVQELNWEKMGSSSNIIFIDPLPFLLQ